LLSDCGYVVIFKKDRHNVYHLNGAVPNHSAPLWKSTAMSAVPNHSRSKPSTTYPNKLTELASLLEERKALKHGASYDATDSMCNPAEKIKLQQLNSRIKELQNNSC
jgi:hypothetical protein